MAEIDPRDDDPARSFGSTSWVPRTVLLLSVATLLVYGGLSLPQIDFLFLPPRGVLVAVLAVVDILALFTWYRWEPAMRPKVALSSQRRREQIAMNQAEQTMKRLKAERDKFSQKCEERKQSLESELSTLPSTRDSKEASIHASLASTQRSLQIEKERLEKAVMSDADKSKKLSAITTRSLRSYKHRDSALKKLEDWYQRRPGEIDKELRELEANYPRKLKELEDKISQAQTIRDAQAVKLKDVPVEPVHFQSLTFSLYLRRVFSWTR